MKVEVKLFAAFTQYLPEGANGNIATMELEEGTSVKDVLNSLKVPPEQIKLIFINSVRANIDDELKDGDKMGAFPPVSGG